METKEQEQDFKAIEELIEHTPIEDWDTTILNDRLLKGKFDIGKIKSVDYSKISKLNASLFDLNRELDFWCNISNFLKNCSYFNSDYTQGVIAHIKDKCIDRLNYYVVELEQEKELLKVVE